MSESTKELLARINREVIRYRGVYARWSTLRGVSYNEMLILYTLQESGSFTQKQLSDNFRLPRQTVHNVVSGMRREGLLKVSPEHSKGREKAFVLTEKGKQYADPLMNDLTAIEEKAVERLTPEKLQILSDLLASYSEALNEELDPEGAGK